MDQIALRWRVVSKGRVVKNTKAKPVRALHVEVVMEDRITAQIYLQKTYHTDVMQFPLGIQMPLVPEMITLLNSQAKTKATHLKAHQQSFFHSLKTADAWKISNLDFYNPGLGG